MGEDKDAALKNADKYKGYNLKRIAEALEKTSKELEKMNWNIGFGLEIKKRKDPVMAKEIKREWEKRKEEKQKEQ